MARAAHPVALSAGIQVAGSGGARLPDRRQAGERRRAPHHEAGRGRARPEDRDRRGAGRAARHLRQPALLDHAVRRAARRGVRPRHAARHPARGARRVPAPAQPVAALPPRAPDRRDDARHRARHARDLDLIVLFIIFHNSSHPGVRACRGGAAQEVRLALRRGHLRRGRRLHRVHGAGHRVAHGDPPARQRARLEGQHARHRQPAELRDGEVLRQRGVRGAALRREPAGLRSGGGEERGFARPAQHRPELDHRRCGDGADAAGGRRRGGAELHPRRPGAGERPADPALHPAQLPRHGVPRDQAGAARHGPHVSPPRRAPRGRGPPGRA